SSDWSGREPGRFLRVLGVSHNAGQWSCAQFLGFLFGGDHHGGGTVRNGRGVGSGNRAVFLESGTQRGDLLGHGFGGGFVLGNNDITLAASDGDWRNFPFKAAVIAGLASAAQRLQRVSILLFAAEL